MSEIQRYDLDRNPTHDADDWCDCKMVAATDGEYVKYAAHEPIDKRVQELEEALNEDATLGIDISNLAAIAWHLEKGHDNGNVEREALAKFLHSLEAKLTAARAALGK